MAITDQLRSIAEDVGEVTEEQENRPPNKVLKEELPRRSMEEYSGGRK